MIRSMTGFGQSSAENERYRIALTLRSVNHRFLDLSIRMPEERRELEGEVRRQLGRVLLRGRVEVRFEIDYLGERQCRLEIQRGVVEALRTALGRAGLESLGSDLSLEDLLRLPEAVSFRMLPGEWRPEDASLMRQVTDEALSQLLEAREGEGRRIREMLENRLQEMDQLTRQCEARREAVRDATQEALVGRLRELLDDAGLSEERLAQETAILIEKSDIQEELDRLRSHLEELRAGLEAEGTVGRRLDFLMQEILRELNTASAKSRDVELSRLLLEARERAEQIREQVQNVE